MNCQRIFAADIDVALIGADRIRGDRHSFEDAMRITFEDAPVHERPGVALIGIADNEFASRRLFGDLGPLKAGRIPGAPATAEPAFGDLLDDTGRSHFVKRAMERLISTRGQVRFDPLGFDDAAVFQNDRQLAGKEGAPRVARPDLTWRFAPGGRFDDGRGHGRRDTLEKRSGRTDLHQRALATKPHAANRRDVNPVQPTVSHGGRSLGRFGQGVNYRPRP